jgi:hypothetical protein
MVKKGVYRDGKVHTHEHVVHDVERTLDWWPNANQEVEFELLNGKAIIKSLGRMLKSEDADKYCRDF